MSLLTQARRRCRPISRISGLVTVVLCLVLAASVPLTAQEAADQAQEEWVVGGGDGFAPFHFLDEQGLPSGFDIDLVRAAARVSGAKLTVRLGPWRDMRRSLREGRIDILAGMSFSEERAESYAFSAPYLQFQYKIFVRTGETTIRDPRDLRGKRIIVQRMGVIQDWVRKNVIEARTLTVDTAARGMLELAEGRGDCFITGEYRGLYVLKELGLEDTLRAGESVNSTGYGFATLSGNSPLVSRLDQALAILHETGEYDEIYRQWFGGLGHASGGSLLEWGRRGWWILASVLLALVALLTWIWWLRRRARLDREDYHKELERREGELQNLRDSEELFRGTFGQSSTLMAITSWPEGVFLEINDAFVRILETPREGLVGFPVEQIDFWADRQQYAAVKLGLRKEGRVLNKELVFRSPSGRTHHLFGSLNRVDLGDRACVLTVAADLSHGREFDQRRAQSEKMDAVGKLAGEIAHDFNNMLTAIQGYGELALADLDTSPVKDHVQGMLAASERAARLTAQLLALSRRQAISPQTLRLGDLLSGLTGQLSEVVGEGIRLEIDPGGEQDSVAVDSERFEQLILELARNGCHAMPDGGTLRLAIDGLEILPSDPRIGLGLSPGPHRVLEVSDTGVGMGPEILPHIYEPFFTTKGPGQGAGLGLAIAYGVVRQSGGVIEAESELGSGTTIRILLPSARASVVLEDREEDVHDVVGGSETLLLAEDEEEVCQLLERVLTSHGYTVLAARDPEVALGKSRKHQGPIDLLITDVVMPRINGRELAALVRSERPETPVLFISGYADQELAAEGESEAGDGFLPKPFSSKQLAAKVRELLDRAGPSGR